VVNDGSTDATADVVHEFANNTPEVWSIEKRLIEGRPIQTLPDERRPGRIPRCSRTPQSRQRLQRARAGMLAARGEVVLFTDADLSAPSKRPNALFDAIRQGADIAIGSRWLQSDRQTSAPAALSPVLRPLLQRRYRARRHEPALRRYPVRPQGILSRGAQTVFQLQTIKHWGFDPEILFIAIKHGYWGHRGSGHVGSRRAHPA